MSDRSTLVEAGRSMIAASRLAGSRDEQFLLGDLLVEAEVSNDDELAAIAEDIGQGLTGGRLKSYRDVAQAWPPETRVDASWTTHRTLAKLDNRRELIKPGMTLRQAQEAAGKRTSDVKHPSRWPFEERVDFLIAQLQDNKTNDAVRGMVEERKKARQVRAAARGVAEDRSAEYKEALRELREANNAKHPERVVIEAIFKLRNAREYVRAVGKMSMDEGSFIADHRKPDVASAVLDLALSAVDALVALGVKDKSVSADALEEIKEHVNTFTMAKVASGFRGVVIDAGDDSDVSGPRHMVVDVESA